MKLTSPRYIPRGIWHFLARCTTVLPAVALHQFLANMLQTGERATLHEWDRGIWYFLARRTTVFIARGGFSSISGTHASIQTGKRPTLHCMRSLVSWRFVETSYARVCKYKTRSFSNMYLGRCSWLQLLEARHKRGTMWDGGNPPTKAELSELRRIWFLVF